MVDNGGSASQEHVRGDSQTPRPGFDVRIPNVARMYDYYLGGKDNFEADREAAEEALAALPETRAGVRLNRAFLGRAVRLLAAEAGVRQFLDIGTGLPTQENTHEVAQRYAPDARVVYVDNDPVVLTHARALLATDAHTIVVDGDVRRPEEILTDPELRAQIDLGQPLAVLLISMLHLVPDHDDPYGIVTALREALVPGSYLILSHLTREDQPGRTARFSEVYDRAKSPMIFRSREEIGRFFDGFDLVEPGLVYAHEWRLDAAPTADEAAAGRFGLVGVGRKP